MPIFAVAERIRSSAAQRWFLSLAAFAVALITRFVFDHALPDGFPYLTFFPAVILTAFFAGRWPGVVCAVASGLSAWYWFIPPFGEFGLNSSVLIALLFYVGVVLVDIVVIELMHRAMDGLRTERAVTSRLLLQQAAMVTDLQEREERQQTLQRELTHRMKNTLAMVQAVVAQSLRHATSIEEAAETSSSRIMALGRSQDMLTESNWQAADIRYVMDAALEPHSDRPDRFTVHGPSMSLNAMQSMGLALTLHELATNAAKYGALSVDAGTITIDWSHQVDGSFALAWKERGGPLVQTPTRRGFGSRLIERVVPGYFGGTSQMTYQPEGVVFTLTGIVAFETSVNAQRTAAA